jgi:hypothetical protein
MGIFPAETLRRGVFVSGFLRVPAPLRELPFRKLSNQSNAKLISGSLGKPIALKGG